MWFFSLVFPELNLAIQCRSQCSLRGFFCLASSLQILTEGLIVEIFVSSTIINQDKTNILIVTSSFIYIFDGKGDSARVNQRIKTKQNKIKLLHLPDFFFSSICFTVKDATEGKTKEY